MRTDREVFKEGLLKKIGQFLTDMPPIFERQLSNMFDNILSVGSNDFFPKKSFHDIF